MKNNSLKVTFAIDKDSWLLPTLLKYIERNKNKCKQINLVFRSKDIKRGDLAFFLSFQEIVQKEILSKNKNNLVVHQSALPKGKGMSPLSWQILEGKNSIPITLFEAVTELDAGNIYIQKNVKFKGTELLNELRKLQAKYTFELCDEFIDNYPEILKKAKSQTGKSSFYKKRTPLDSELDINKSILDQIDLLRIVDNRRFPAYFYYKEEKFKIKIYKNKK
tara:strand:- start:2801 stop:3460 length:660 start_codon:yes stop_codon:yes gene_type:complete